MDWHFKLRDMSKFELVRLIEEYDRYIKKLRNSGYFLKTIEKFIEGEQN